VSIYGTLEQGRSSTGTEGKTRCRHCRGEKKYALSEVPRETPNKENSRKWGGWVFLKALGYRGCFVHDEDA